MKCENRCGKEATQKICEWYGDDDWYYCKECLLKETEIKND